MARTSRLFIRFYIVSALIILVKETNASGIHQSENFHVIDDKSIPNLTNILGSSNYKHIGEYELLDTRCTISECRGSTADNILTHQFCFNESKCPYQHYHCLHKGKHVIHFCTAFDDCQLRSKDVAVFDVRKPKVVNIYNVPCEFGFFQPNEKHSCFMPCVNDTSIGFVASKRRGTPPLAYCHTQHGCNKFGKMFFQLGSQYDDCTGRQNQCSSFEDILPDCTCAHRCPPNHDRLPENNFTCSPRATEEAMVDVSNTTSLLESSVEVSEPTGHDEGYSVKTSDDKPHPETEPTGHDNRYSVKTETETPESYSSNDNNGVLIGLLVALVCLVTVILAVLAGIYIKRRRKRERVPSLEETRQDDKDGKQSERSCTDTVTITKYNFNADKITFVNSKKGNVTHNSHVQQNKSFVESSASGSDCSIPVEEEQRMNLLQSFNVVGDVSETSRKQVY